VKNAVKACLYSFLVGVGVVAMLYEAFRVPAAVLDPETIKQTQCACGPNDLGAAVVYPSEIDAETGEILGQLCDQWCLDQLGVCTNESGWDRWERAPAMEGVLEL